MTQVSVLANELLFCAVAGPFRPCDSLLGSWLVRVGLWCISLVSLLGNSILLLSLFGSSGYLSPLRFTVACMGASNLLTGVCMCTLALVDALTLGEFGHHGARWEGGPGCQATGWVWVFASEASVLLLTLAAVQCGVSVTCARTYGKSPSLVSVRTCALFCLVLSVTLASLPLAGVGEYGSSPFCLPSPLPPPSSRLPSSLGFPLALIMMNTLCLLIVTGSHIRLYWELLRGECEGLWDCAMIKHVAWLIFTNGLLYVPVAFLSLCSLLGLLSLGEEVLKSVLLLLQPLPACLNPLLFLLFTRDHSQLFFWPRPKARTQLRRDHTLDSLVSVETEKSSCSDSSTQVSLTDATYSGGSSLQARQDPIRFSHCSSTSSVPLIPCQIPPPTARDRERVAEWERERVSGWWFLESLDQDVYHTATSLTLNVSPMSIHASCLKSSDTIWILKDHLLQKDRLWVQSSSSSEHSTLKLLLQRSWGGNKEPLKVESGTKRSFHRKDYSRTMTLLFI